MYARVFRPNAPAAGAPIVLVPGLSISGRYMLRLARRLAPRRTVFVVDLPGSGKSAPPPHPLSPREEARVLADWAQKVGSGRAVWIGNSLGCHALLHLAAERPDLAEAVVLLGPALEPTARTMPKQLWRFFVTGLLEPFSLWRIALSDYFRAGVVRTFGTAKRALEDEVEKVAPRVRAKVLLVRGELDRVSSEAWVRELQALLPDARAVTFRRVAHAVNYDAPESLAALVLDFVDSAGPKCASSERATRSGASMVEKWPTPSR